MPQLPVDLGLSDQSNSTSENKSEVDLQKLAEKIVERLIRELEIENERLGRS